MDTFLAIGTAAFVLSAVDYWIDLRIYRGVVAALVTALAFWVLTKDSGAQIVATGLTGGFIVVAVIRLIETLNVRLKKPMVIQRGRP
jgi:hypothetical protein